jgi:hypothetical protein
MSFGAALAISLAALVLAVRELRIRPVLGDAPEEATPTDQG